MREIQLRNGEHTWATLRIEPDGRKLLCHRLSAAEIAACPPLLPFEGNKRLDCKLIVSSHGPCVEIAGPMEGCNCRRAMTANSPRLSTPAATRSSLSHRPRQRVSPCLRSMKDASL